MRDDAQTRLAELHKSSLASIAEMVAALDTDDDEAREKAEETIHNDPLSIDVRSNWESVGATLKPSQYRILLTTGGPAVQIVGDLSEYGEPETAKLQVQDWFQPWTEHAQSEDDDEALLTYARQFYFGD